MITIMIEKLDRKTKPNMTQIPMRNVGWGKTLAKNNSSDIFVRVIAGK